MLADYVYRCEPCAARFAETGKRSQRKNGIRLVFVIVYVTKTDLDGDLHPDDPFSLALMNGYVAIACVATRLPMIGLSFRPTLRL